MAPIPETDSSTDPLDVKLSVTDMNGCHHGPLRNCPRCMVTELVAALEEAIPWLERGVKFYKFQRAGHEFYPNREEAEATKNRAHFVLARAKSLDPTWEHRELDKRPQDVAEMLAEMGRARRKLGERVKP